MPVAWREYEGVPYLYVDFRGLTPEDQLATLADMTNEILNNAQPGVRILADVRGVVPEPRFLMASKRSSAEVTGPYRAVTAVVGVDGVKAAMLRGHNTVGRGAKAWPFRSIQEALEFLGSGRTAPGRRGTAD